MADRRDDVTAKPVTTAASLPGEDPATHKETPSRNRFMGHRVKPGGDAARLERHCQGARLTGSIASGLPIHIGREPCFMRISQGADADIKNAIDTKTVAADLAKH